MRNSIKTLCQAGKLSIQDVKQTALCEQSLYMLIDALVKSNDTIKEAM